MTDSRPSPAGRHGRNDEPDAMSDEVVPRQRSGESAAAAALRARIASLSPAKRALFERAELLRSASPRGDAPESAIAPLAPGGRAPLSFVQEMLWLLHRASPNMVAYNSPRAYRIAGEFDPAALQAAVNALVDRHEIFRTSIAIEDGVPVQLVRPPTALPIVTHDLSELPAGAREDELRSAVQHELHTPFDLERDLLLRVTTWRLAPDDHVLLLVSHHTASDEWSRGILAQELASVYASARRGAPPSLPPLPIQYRDYAAWQRRRFTPEAAGELIDFWRRTLRDVPLLDLPTDHARPAEPRFEGGTVAADVPDGLLSDLQSLAEAQGVSLFMLLLAAFQVLLHRYTGQEDIAVGSPFAGRPRPETQGLVGYFSNTVVLRARLEGNPRFTDFLQSVRQVCLDAYDHAELPFEKLVHELRQEREVDTMSGRMPLVRALFTLTGDRAGGLVLDGASSVTPFAAGGRWTKLDIGLVLRQRRVGGNETLRAVLEYSSDLFETGTAQRLLDHYATLLGSIVRDPTTRVSALPIMVRAEHDRLLEWGRGRVSHQPPTTVTDLIARQAARTPDSTAVRFGDATLSYARLEQRAEQLASVLRSHGVGVGTAVGVCLERSPELMVALLGVMKVGAYYVPLDPQYPAERLAYIVADSRARAVIHRGALPAAVSEVMATERIESLRIDRLPSGAAEPTRAPESVPTPDDLAYVIYTSGSTGKPKGVMIRHRSVASYLQWMQREYPVGAQDRVLQKAPISFDASVWELFLPLIAGAQLVLARSDRQQDPDYLLDLIERAGITVLQLVPSQLRMLLAGPIERGLASVRHVVCGGEALAADLLAAVRPRVRARITNLYGPTEATVYATHWSLAPDADWSGDVVPIGTPIDDVRVAVLDPQGVLTPIGVPGELVIAGAGVAAGYAGRPELTADRFVPDQTSAERGARMYRTNDRVRWRSDGTLEFFGRFDDQVKLRGFRVELGEIESRLAEQPGIRGAVAAVRHDTPGDAQLVAYVVIAPDAPIDETIREARSRLRASLPAHMLPAHIIPIERIPLGPTGKADRRALPSVNARAHGQPKPAAAPPRTTIEHELLAIWERLLPGQSIGIDDDFFEIGGHSLLAMQMLVEIERIRGRRLPFATLFTHTTVESLAAVIGGAVQEEGERRILVLNPDGSRHPLFFLHGDVRGGGWYARRLARILGEDRPVAVLATVAPDNVARAETIAEMARYQIEAMRSVQPSGPYLIAGFCASGLIAFEIAQQLRRAGEEVRGLVLADTAALNAGFGPLATATRLALLATPRARRLDRLAAVLYAARYYRTRVRQVAGAGRREQLQWAVRILARSARIGVRQADADAQGMLAGPASGAGLETLRFQQRAAVAYIPKRYFGTLDLILATGEHGRRTNGDQTRGWARLVRDIEVQTVATSHVGLITRNLDDFAAALARCLELRDPA